MPKKDDKETDLNHLEDIPRLRKEPRPDFSQPLPHVQLPKSITKNLNDEEELWGSITEGTAGDSTDSNVRFAAYASRLRTIMLSAHRYVAYTSDVGESFRPVAHPYWIRGAYAVSWLYLVGDVSHEGYKAYIRNQKTLHPEKYLTGQTTTMSDARSGNDVAPEPGLAAATKATTTDLVKPGKVAPLDDYRTVMVQRAVFQSIASMGLPAFTIHSIVKYSGKAFKNAANKNIRTWAPIGLGLAAVPALPYLFDKPVEEAVEWVFHKGFEAVGGTAAVSEEAKHKKEL